MVESVASMLKERQQQLEKNKHPTEVYIELKKKEEKNKSPKCIKERTG